MKIYINDFTNPVKAEILPADIPTQDETLESLSFALISNDQPMPYAPMQKVKVDFTGDGTDVQYFYIVSDSVSTYSLAPLKYKHTLSCIQNTRVLSKHLVRNSIFTQPGYTRKTLFNAESMIASDYESNKDITWANPQIPSLNWASEKLTLTSKERIKSSRIKFSFQWTYDDDDSPAQEELVSDAHGVSDILPLVPLVASLSIVNYLTLQYKDANNQTQTETINASDFGSNQFDLNSSYDFPRIKELAEQGCNQFEILFPTLEMVTGRWIVNDPQNPPPVLSSIRFWMWQVEVEAEIYTYTVYDILELLLQRQRRIRSGYSRYTDLFKLPEWTDGENPKEDELYELLTTTIAPNFYFTQLTMYECVAEIFRLFDAIFTMDENGKLGIEYFNNLTNEPIPNDKFTGRTLSLGEEKYVNGLVSEYQDARIEETFPNNGDFIGLRSVEFGVPEPQDHNFITPHNIDYVNRLEIQLTGMTRNNSAISSEGILVVDITRHVVEQTVWSMMDTGPITPNNMYDRIVKQANCLYYTKGDNKICVAFTFKDSWNMTHYTLSEAIEMALNRMAGTEEGLAGTTDIGEAQWHTVKMRINYISTVDGRTRVESIENKYAGDMLIDQNNGAVDLNKMGLNMMGLSLKLGNPTLNATHKISKWSDRIKTGQIYRYQNAIWVANVVNYTFFNGFIQGKVSFVQNFNQLSLRTKLLREKRMSNISNELITKSEDIITEYIYYSTIDPIPQDAPNYPLGVSEGIQFNSTYLHRFLAQSFSTSEVTLKIKDIYMKKQMQIWVAILDAFIYIPKVLYGAGNTINFEFGFNHPMSAGQLTAYSTSASGKNVGYFTYKTTYTDEYGYLDKIDIIASRLTLSTDSFPIYASLGSSAANQYYFRIQDLFIYKQPNEIFALNYQLAFLPMPERKQIDFIGSEFINTNCFVKDLIGGNKKKYICIFDTESSVLDLKATGYFIKVGVTLGDSHSYYKTTLTFTFRSLSDSEYERAKSWAIVDENDNILFASNTKPTLVGEGILGFSYVNIYFISRRNRL